MRELTAEEKNEYDHIILGARQMRITELIGDDPEPINTLPSFSDETDSKIIFTQMELFSWISADNKWQLPLVISDQIRSCLLLCIYTISVMRD